MGESTEIYVNSILRIEKRYLDAKLAVYWFSISFRLAFSIYHGENLRICFCLLSLLILLVAIDSGKSVFVIPPLFCITCIQYA